MEGDIMEPISPCAVCSTRSCRRMRTPCPPVEQLLPKERTGRKHWEQLAGQFRDQKIRFYRDMRFRRRERIIAQTRLALDHARLTDRQREIMERWLWLGRSQRSIAAELATSRTYVRRVLDRFTRKP